MNVDGLAFDDGSAGGRASTERPSAFARLGIGPYDRDVSQGYRHRRDKSEHLSVAQSRGIFGDRIQHRLNIRRRAGDDA